MRNADLLTHSQPFRRNVSKSFQRHMAAHMKNLQFRWLDAPRSIGTARSTQVPGYQSPVAAGTKADALTHGGMGGNEVLQQVLQRAILAQQKASVLEASLKDMTAQRDKWVLQADYWKEQAQHALPSPARHTSCALR
jgi:hypothetical protein